MLYHNVHEFIHELVDEFNVRRKFFVPSSLVPLNETKLLCSFHLSKLNDSTGEKVIYSNLNIKSGL